MATLGVIDKTIIELSDEASHLSIQPLTILGSQQPLCTDDATH